MNVGISFDPIYIVPFDGSTAELPQLAPPLWPGISIVPRRLGGVNTPSLRELFSNSRNDACSSDVRNGLMSFSVNVCRANRGGIVGLGWVGARWWPPAAGSGTRRCYSGHSRYPC